MFPDTRGSESVWEEAQGGDIMKGVTMGVTGGWGPLPGTRLPTHLVVLGEPRTKVRL